MEFIRLKQVLDIMDSGQEFSIAWVTCDRKRKSGGEIIAVDKAVKPKKEVRPSSGNISDGISRIGSQNHFSNATRNIYIPASKQTRKLHIWLIVRFNNKKVHW